jgi:hypothetical protein
MSKEIDDKLALCRNLDFGAPALPRNLLLWNDALNEEIFSLCRGLPLSQQSEGLLFLMGYARISLGEKFDFFKNFYSPLWSVLPHVSLQEPGLFPHYVHAHAMAMFLHSFEDHITDREMNLDNLKLLLHGEAWRLYRNSLDVISGEDRRRREVAGHHLDRYFSSIAAPPSDETLTGYCNHFRKQMANLTLVAVLLAEEVYKDNEPVEHLIRAFESFGTAWRLLDDLNDLENDIIDKTRSACYYILPEDWRSRYRLQQDGDREVIMEYLAESGHLEVIMELIVSYLAEGRDAAQAGNMPAYGEELSRLAEPVVKALEGM